MSRLTKLFVLLLVAEAIVIGIRFWNRTPLPEVPWDQLDPAVAAEIRVIEDSLNPRQAADWSEMGDVYRTFGLFPQASHCYGKASALQPDNPYNTYTWAICRELMGEIRPAIELFQRAKSGFDMASGDANAPAFSAYCSLNIGQCLLKEGRLANAEQSLKEALPLPKAGLLLGRILARTGRAGEATTILSDVLKEYPNDLTANLLMSYAEAELGRGTSALDYRERALRGSPIIPVWDITYPAIRKRRENMGTLGWYARSQALQAKGNLAGAMEESKTRPRHIVDRGLRAASRSPASHQRRCAGRADVGDKLLQDSGRKSRVAGHSRKRPRPIRQGRRSTQRVETGLRHGRRFPCGDRRVVGEIRAQGCGRH